MTPLLGTDKSCVFKVLIREFLACIFQPLLFLAFKHKNSGFVKEGRVVMGTLLFPLHAQPCQLWFSQDLGVRHVLRVRMPRSRDSGRASSRLLIVVLSLPSFPLSFLLGEKS